MINLSYNNFTKYWGKANQNEWIKDELEDSFKKYNRIQIEETNQIYDPADKDKLLMEICEYLEKWDNEQREQKRKDDEEINKGVKLFCWSFLLIPVSFCSLWYIAPEKHIAVHIFCSFLIYTIVIPIIYFIYGRVRKDFSYETASLLAFLAGVFFSFLGYLIGDRVNDESSSTNKEVVSPSSQIDYADLKIMLRDYINYQIASAGFKVVSITDIRDMHRPNPAPNEFQYGFKVRVRLVGGLEKTYSGGCTLDDFGELDRVYVHGLY